MAASPPSTSFAALLKRSKFATFQPSIAQVYTTYEGNAFRGDWGLKRPLSVRKRKATLLVQAVDTREQQTEFRSGEPEANMRKRWQETGSDVNPSTENTQWQTQIVGRSKMGTISSATHEIDSEFSDYKAPVHPDAGAVSPALRVKVPPSIESVPNFSQMTRRQFEKHLESIRSIRSSFKQSVNEVQQIRRKSLEASGKEPREHFGSLFHMGASPAHGIYAKDYIAHMHGQMHGDPTSKTLEPFPHRNGGLAYTQSNPFQTNLMYDAIPARVTNRSQLMSRFSSSTVAMAGIAAELKHSNKEFTEMIDWERKNVSQGSLAVRVQESALMDAPEVVSKGVKPPRGLQPMRLKLEVASVRDSSLQTNPYRPGSLQYSHAEPPIMGKRRSRPVSFSQQSRGRVTQQKRDQLLSNITRLMEKR